MPILGTTLIDEVTLIGLSSIQILLPETTSSPLKVQSMPNHFVSFPGPLGRKESSDELTGSKALIKIHSGSVGEPEVMFNIQYKP